MKCKDGDIDFPVNGRLIFDELMRLIGEVSKAADIDLMECLNDSDQEAKTPSRYLGDAFVVAMESIDSLYDAPPDDSDRQAFNPPPESSGDGLFSWHIVMSAFLAGIAYAGKNGADVSAASVLARRRHAGTYKKHDELIAAWRAHCTPEMPAQRAATKLAILGEVEADGKLSHKTAVGVISPVRKKELMRKK